MLRIELPAALKAHKVGRSPGKGIADWGEGVAPEWLLCARSPWGTVAWKEVGVLPASSRRHCCQWHLGHAT